MKNAHPQTPEPFFLAIESSGRVGSAALGRGSEVLEEIVFSGKMRHSSELFPALSRILNQVGCNPKDIQTLCFTVGPGSFTGLRIAVTTAKMLNFAHKTRLVAVSTLNVIAENATEYIRNTGQPIQAIATILDAKQDKFYAAIYRRENDIWKKDLQDVLIEREVLIKKILQDPSNPVTILGEGLVYHEEQFRAKKIQILPPEYWPARARNVLKKGYELAQQGQFADPLTLVPCYIRRPDAMDKWDNKE